MVGGEANKAVRHFDEQAILEHLSDPAGVPLVGLQVAEALVYALLGHAGVVVDEGALQCQVVALVVLFVDVLELGFVQEARVLCYHETLHAILALVDLE